VPFAFNKIIEVRKAPFDLHAERLRRRGPRVSMALARPRRDAGTWLETSGSRPDGPRRVRWTGRATRTSTGTGSWDFGGGLARAPALLGLDHGAFTANTPGSSTGYGDVLLANSPSRCRSATPSGPSFDWLTVGLELNFRYAGYDTQDGERYEDSGGSILYAAPSVRIRLPFTVGEQAPSLRAAVQLPLTQDWLHGFQREKEVWSVGLLMPF
jgi:hypothetical protein